jgi:hypothetical protein
VETRLGTLNFFDGFPDDATVEKLYDNLDFQRAVQAYLLGLAPMSQVANRKGILWVQTIPGKGWNTLLRLYGPLEPWFDKTWRPGEIELVKWERIKK